MRRLYLAILANCFAAYACAQAGFAPQSNSSFEPRNHADLVDALIRYHDFGQYGYEIRQVANSARVYVEEVIKGRRQGDKLAAVFDIDETALSNWNLMLDCGFCSYDAQRKLYPFPAPGPPTCAKEHPTYQCDPAHLPAIVPVRELYEFAKEKGMAVFFVTGRPDKQKDLTRKNLEQEGYPPWDGLFMQEGEIEPASVFKPKVRHQIMYDLGYRIVLNIGDQASDLAGCCAERVFKLPNPFYLIP